LAKTCNHCRSCALRDDTRCRGRPSCPPNLPRLGYDAADDVLGSDPAGHSADIATRRREYAALHAQLVRLLSPLSVQDLIAIEKFIIDAWRLRRAFRFELSATENPDAGMSSPGMPNLLRYMNSANRQFDQSYARIKEICERKRASAAAQLAVAAARVIGGNQQTLDSSWFTGQPENWPTSASADAGDGSAGTAHAQQAAHSAAPAQAAQPGGCSCGPDDGRARGAGKQQPRRRLARFGAGAGRI
jgi:hypothetical protein